MPRERSDELTERENQVAWHVADEKTYQEIAEELGISSRTVESHVGSIKEKLGVKSIVGIGRYVERTSNDGDGSEDGSSSP